MEIYEEQLAVIDTKIFQLGNIVTIENENGQITIEDGFINHFFFKRGHKYEEQIIKFCILISNKTANLTRSPEHVFLCDE